PQRVEDYYVRGRVALMLMTPGLDRLARTGARRLKVGFESDAARGLYFGGGFVQSSVDPLLIRAGRNYGAGVSATPENEKTPGQPSVVSCCSTNKLPPSVFRVFAPV